MSSPGGPRTRATIRDVAALAGVGMKTVSRVINDEANVAPHTRDRVQRAVRALNFSPHLGAGSLRRKENRTRTLGLLLDAVDNPFSAAVSRGVERVAERHSTAVLAASFHGIEERERALVEVFTRRRVDGLILTTISNDHSYLHHERELGTPIAFVDRPPVGLAVDAVLVDDHDAARTATRHLIGHGHTRIAYLGDRPEIATAAERRRGYGTALGESGLTGQDGFQRLGLDTEQAAYDAVLALLGEPDPPTALFASQNLITIGAVRALHHLGAQRRVALVGFDDVVLADLVRPGITTMATDPARMGAMAAELVFERLDGDGPVPRTLVVPAQLICRGSGELPPPSR